jgi:hypothetical protein
MPGLSLGMGLSMSRPQRKALFGASLVLDFVAGRYEINGVPFAQSGFTTVAGAPVFDPSGLVVDGDDKLKVPNVNWFTPGEGTFLVDWVLPAPTAAANLFSMSGGSGGTATRIEVGVANNSRNGSLTLQAYDTAARVLTYPIGYRTKPCRLLFTLKTGEKSRVCCHSDAAGGAVSEQGFNWFAPTVAVTQAGLGYRILFNDQPFTGTVRRAIFWPRKLSDDEMLALYLAGDATNVHLLGDSFVNTSSVAALYTRFIDQRRVISMDGVGGASLVQQAARFAATSQYWDRTLVILDGGLSDTVPEAIAAVQDMAGRLAHGRWLYAQGGIDRTSTPAQVATKLANDAQLAAAFGDRYCPTYDYMRSHGTGSTTGANGGAVWAADNYGDDLHPSSAGYANLLTCVGDFLVSAGW